MKKETDLSFEWRQFAKLGDMMGDGLHHEPGGGWISKEYKRLSKILLPDKEFPEFLEWKKKARVDKNKLIDNKINELLLAKKCHCGGTMKQVRSGSFKVVCTECNSVCKAKTVKKAKQ